MPTYRMTDEDGTVHEIDGPENASRQQVIAAIQANLTNRKVRQAEEDYLQFLSEREEVPLTEEDEDSSLLGNIGRGLGAGFVNTLENSALGLATLLDEGAELTARDAIKGVADSIKPELTDPEAVSTKLAQGVGSILGFVPCRIYWGSTPRRCCRYGG